MDSPEDRHIFSSNKKTHLLDEQDDMYCCSTRLHTCLRVEQKNMSSCSTRIHVFLFNKKTCLLVGQEDVPSYPCVHRVGSSKNQLFGVSCRGHTYMPHLGLMDIGNCYDINCKVMLMSLKQIQIHIKYYPYLCCYTEPLVS